MPNERLRAALLERGLTPALLGEQLGVDQKTVERWISGRSRTASIAMRSPHGWRWTRSYLWPDALSRDQVTAASESEVLAIYPHRSDVPRDAWERLFSSAEREIGVLVYAGLFLAEDADGSEHHRGQGPGRGPGARLAGRPGQPAGGERGIDEGVPTRWR